MTERDDMPCKTYLWIEDRQGNSGHTFWSVLMQQICPEVIVEGRKNNSELVKAVKKLEDKENRYIIVLDNAFDNVQAYQEQKRIKEYIDKKHNVVMMDIICFEYILLEFDKLTDWIYAPEDEFFTKRLSAIYAREKLVEILRTGETDYKAIREIVEYDAHPGRHNIEQLSSKLLFDLTRNTGFEVTKGKIGSCWILSCCDWKDRQEDDICGLDERRLLLSEKMKAVLMGTSLYGKFLQAGLEVLS